MRKCLRCKEEMIENYRLEVSNWSAIGTLVLAKGGNLLLSDTIGKVNAAVCPKCGEIPIYLDDLDKINKR
ncbi:MAG: hypothetical protein EOM50_05600 [Erysipelotrichia bacterium]|nr:hypothetical protein [Erysipelotrichia bacterium]NCC54204.1 hypothetical protein [Erysipelotrichia bacterium]